MKSLVVTLLLIFGSYGLSQGQSFFPLDKSPMDVAYLPDHFAHDRKPGQKAIVKVYYSRPQKKGRDIFGAKTPYGKVWRTGANEAIEFKAYEDIKLAGNKLDAGTYSLFTIPGETEWTIIINSDLDYWGAYSYNEKHDVMRFKVPSGSSEQEIEAFSIRFEALEGNNAVMRMGWDRTVVEVPIEY